VGAREQVSGSRCSVHHHSVCTVSYIACLLCCRLLPAQGACHGAWVACTIITHLLTTATSANGGFQVPRTRRRPPRRPTAIPPGRPSGSARVSCDVCNVCGVLMCLTLAYSVPHLQPHVCICAAPPTATHVQFLCMPAGFICSYTSTCCAFGACSVAASRWCCLPPTASHVCFVSVHSMGTFALAPFCREGGRGTGQVLWGRQRR
jgi:hypothetical protein